MVSENMSTRALFPVVIGLMCGLVAGLGAQHYQEVAPKPVPISEGGAMRTPDPPAAEGAGEVLVEELRGIVFVRSPEEVQKEGIEVDGMRAENMPLLQKPEARRIADSYLGRRVTMDLLNELARDVVIYYRDQGRPVVDVVLPEQDITTGTVQLVVIEGGLGRVWTEGNEWFEDEMLIGQIRLEPGEPVATRTLRDDINWLNRNPFREVDVLLTPGDREGLVDLVLQVEDRRPYRYYMGYEDSGNNLTGSTRWLAGFNWGNAGVPDAQFNYQFTSSSEFDRLRAHALSYIVPLPWRHVLTTYGSIVSTDVSDGPFDVGGTASQLGLRYAVPLPSFETPRLRHDLNFGFDYKKADTDVQFGAIRALDTETEIGQFSLGYRAAVADPLGHTALDVAGHYSPGAMFNKTSDHEFEAVRARADAEYFYARLDLERWTDLPSDFQLHNELAYQESGANLLPSEQLGFGGYYSIRGFDPRALGDTDEGWYLRNELRLPALHLTPSLGCGDVADELRFLIFLDYGVAQRHKALPGQDPRLTMSSIGPGLRYRVERNLELRVDYAIPWHNPDLSEFEHRWHVGLLLAF